MNKRKIVIATGGTGGHINPAIVVAEKLIQNNYDVLVVGNDKIKNYLVDKNIDYKIINCGNSLTNFKSLFNIIRGIFQSIKILFCFKPSVVIGFGSYTTLPILLICKIKKIKILLHEGNSFIGKINNFFLKDAIYIFTSFQEMYGINIKYSNKIYFTGFPLKKEVKKLYNSIYSYPDNENKFKILITGGSGGASFFASVFLEMFNYIDSKIKKNIKVFHQVKENEELDKVKLFYNQHNIENEVKEFFDDLPTKMMESNLIICRAGIGTASEVAVIGRPVIFIPSPNVINNHQFYNANFFKKSASVIVVEEKYFLPNKFAEEFTNLIQDKDKLIYMANNIKSLATLNAEDEILKVVDDLYIEEEIK